VNVVKAKESKGHEDNNVEVVVFGQEMQETTL
jgi:hypothetical protein